MRSDCAARRITLNVSGSGQTALIHQRSTEHLRFVSLLTKGMMGGDKRCAKPENLRILDHLGLLRARP